MPSTRTTPPDTRPSSCVATSRVGAALYIRSTTIALKKSLTAFSPKHACPSRRAKCEAVSPMPLEAILTEAEQLHNVSNRLEALAEQHPPVSDALPDYFGKRAQHGHCPG